VHGKGKQRLSVAEKDLHAKKRAQMVEKATYQVHYRRHGWAVPATPQCILPGTRRHRELVVKVLEPVKRNLKPGPSGGLSGLFISLILQPL